MNGSDEREEREKWIRNLLAPFENPSKETMQIAESASLALVLRDQRIKEMKTQLMPAGFSLGAATNIGARATNQDRALATRSRLGNAWVAVVDGMGGHPNGDEAADAAIQVIRSAVKSGTHQPRNAIEDAHRAVAVLSTPQHGRRTPGAAAAIVAIRPLEDGRAFYQCANVGDVRAYKLHNEGWTLISIDQNISGVRFQLGEISIETLTNEPCQSGLLTYLGDTKRPIPIVSDGFLEPGDGILVLSDGVWDPIHRHKQPLPRPPGGWAALAEQGAIEDLCARVTQLSDYADNATAAIAIFLG